ncbi:hypothetical protein [Comamonas sediminis]|uniref:Uncharacterized protein n=1 Tax=Comamonas sediminis TaxID=1783360 RepID=A0ABV4B2P4_9BURK
MIKEDDVIRFIEICDEAISKAPVFSTLEDLCVYFKTDQITSYWANNFLGGFLKEQVLNSEGGIFLGKLKSALYRREQLFDLKFKYSFICGTLHYYLGNRETIRLDQKEKWIAITQKIILLSCYINDDQIDVPEKDKIVAANALFLAKNGYEVNISGNTFVLTDKTKESIATKINQLAKEIGGRRIIQHLFKDMRGRMWYRNERYSIPNLAKTNPLPIEGASMPIGYILNISSKHLIETPHNVKAESINYFIDLSTAFISTYDVEVFNAFELNFVDAETLPKYITDAILREVFFSFKQLSPDDCLEYLKNLFSWVDNKYIKEKIQWDLNDFIKIAEILVKPYPHNGITIFYTVESICKATCLNKLTVNKILNSITHKTFEVNENYIIPNDSKKLNLHSKPLIWQKGNKYLMLDPALAGIGLITALMTTLRGVYEDTDSNVGESIEKFLFDFLNKEKIQPTLFSEEYEFKGKSFECDVVIESEKKTIFLESKKKTITAAALSGDPASAIIDLSLSFFSSQKQILTHYLSMLTNKKIEFKNGIILKQREEIDGISISLFDWGMLQNRLISMSILRNFIGKNFSDPEFHDQDKIKRCNKTIDDVTRLRAEIIKISKDQDPIHDFVFLSVPHLLHMIRLSSGKDDFLNNFSTFKRCIISGNDVHGSLDYIQLLKSHKIRND